MPSPRKTKSESVQLRMRPDHLALIRAEAEKSGLSLSAWITERLLSAAAKERNKRLKA